MRIHFVKKVELIIRTKSMHDKNIFLEILHGIFNK